MSWPDFKKEIIEIYIHRIEQAAEINGVTNTSYMTMDEHLVVYFVSIFTSNTRILKSGNRELHGTKSEIQQKLLEFLFSLKYYSSRWQRAKFYAQ